MQKIKNKEDLKEYKKQRLGFHETDLEYHDKLVKSIIKDRKAYEKGSICMRWSADDIYYICESIDKLRKNNWVVIERKLVGEKTSNQYWKDSGIFEDKVSKLIPFYTFKPICNCSSKKIAFNIVKINKEKNDKYIFDYYVSNNYNYTINDVIDGVHIQNIESIGD